ncbi:2-hydroxychromene-2-carboxylate isomerase [Nioella aestuarii]|uniref:2-hydroxychromene-2-carboxylate isomerase n=1 Tax=Nioella aestuarii TaxID=1662864 RepID=UPI003D7FA7F1
MANIDYYFSTLSPFTYLAGTGLEEIAARHGAGITYKPMDIMTLFTRTGGTAPKDRHPARMAYRAQELRRAQVKSGLPLNIKPMFWPTNPAPSSYAIITAQKTGGGDLAGLVHGILRACWAEEKDIAENDVVRAALAATGFDPDLADKGMLSAAEEYARNLEDAVSANVFGAPFYIVDGTEHFWGHDRLQDLDRYLAGDL